MRLFRRDERASAAGPPCPDVRFAPEAIRTIMNYPWPGNVRELANMVEHSLICAIDGTVQPESLPDTLLNYCAAKQRPETRETPQVDEHELIRDALQKSAGNKTLAAQVLGIDRSTLWRKMQRLGIE